MYILFIVHLEVSSVSTLFPIIICGYKKQSLKKFIRYSPKVNAERSIADASCIIHIYKTSISIILEIPCRLYQIVVGKGVQFCNRDPLLNLA